MAEKKSVLSMLTAGTGAIVNIILNLILIPKFNAFGAAIATAIAFITVFILRIFNTKKYVNIKINYPVFLVSAVLLAVMAVVMINEIGGGQWPSFFITLALGAVVILINLRSVIDIVKLLLGKFIKKKQTKEE